MSERVGLCCSIARLDCLESDTSSETERSMSSSEFREQDVFDTEVSKKGRSRIGIGVAEYRRRGRPRAALVAQFRVDEVLRI